MEGQAGRETQTSLPASTTSGDVLYGMGRLHIGSGTSLILCGWFGEIIGRQNPFSIINAYELSYI